MDYPLIFAIVAILTISCTSISLGALLSFSVVSKMIDLLVSLSVGMMLSTSLLHALPEAFEHSAEGETSHLFMTLLIGLLGFFLLEKLSIFRHSHHHEGDGHHHEHGFDKQEAGHYGWMILIGHSFHSATDGVLIVAAFMMDSYLGLITSLAIVAHEVPQQTSDFIVMLNAGLSRLRALCYSFCNLITCLTGAVVGYFALDHAEHAIPYVLTLASAGFIYIALSDLMPQMQKRTELKHTIPQIILVGVGIALVYTLTHFIHPHCH